MLDIFATPDFSGFGFLTPAVHGAGDAGEGGALALLDNLLEDFTRMTEPGGATGLLPGILALGFNVHPMVVHFPIALLTSFLVLEACGVAFRNKNLRLVASWMLYLGALGAIAAAIAGLVAEGMVPHGEEVHDIMERHELFGLTVAGLSIILAIWRAAAWTRFSAMAQGLHLFLASIVAICLFFGADLGGLMVYRYGVGVQSLQQADDHHHAPPGAEHEHTHPHRASDGNDKPR
jgi:uncharacterized membrane protein